MSKKQPSQQSMMPGFALPPVDPVKKSSRPKPKPKAPDPQVIPIVRGNTPATPAVDKVEVEPNPPKGHKPFERKWGYIAYMSENLDNKNRPLLNYKRECGHYDVQSISLAIPTSFIVDMIREYTKHPCPTCKT